ncbi:hypothetical protein O6H91_Y563700 [Diphasiastrum complanatum]|nr:hypothetical protein O6H91_Y563700 [Diphasiastrum complanatum]
MLVLGTSSWLSLIVVGELAACMSSGFGWQELKAGKLSRGSRLPLGCLRYMWYQSRLAGQLCGSHRNGHRLEFIKTTVVQGAAHSVSTGASTVGVVGRTGDLMSQGAALEV